jgi:EAL domain-containing protein (putative c-di-GMP-specific phosphodiesterase class I)
VGVEALARWNHPTRGLLGPGEFIPVAEDSGLIAELGRFVLDEACRQLAAWRAQGLDGLTMAVNVSARQLTNAAFPAAVRATLADTAVPADRLHLEITEAAVADGDSRVAHVLDELRHMGVHLTLDNFGTGSSSLGLLRRLPVDAVKVDRSFVAELSHLPEDASTVAAVLGMARGLGLATFGEGVEQEGQLDELGRLGCEFAQGYLLSRPGEAELIPALAGLDLRSAEVRPRT